MTAAELHIPTSATIPQRADIDADHAIALEREAIATWLEHQRDLARDLAVRARGSQQWNTALAQKEIAEHYDFAARVTRQGEHWRAI